MRKSFIVVSLVVMMAMVLLLVLSGCSPQTLSTAAFKMAGSKVDNENVLSSGALKVTSSKVVDDNIVIQGKTTIDPSVSTYIQYYVGKEFPGTTTNCILCAGFNADDNGNFELVLPTSKLRGSGKYDIVFEQNPNSNSILPPEHWMAFYKDTAGVVHFGDISSMGEIANLALTVGMEIVETKVNVK
jgi:hypothetical protein